MVNKIAIFQGGGRKRAALHLNKYRIEKPRNCEAQVTIWQHRKKDGMLGLCNPQSNNRPYKKADQNQYNLQFSPQKSFQNIPTSLIYSLFPVTNFQFLQS